MTHLDPGWFAGIYVAEITESFGSKVLIPVIFVCIRMPVGNVVSIGINVNICRTDESFYFVGPFICVCIETFIADLVRILRITGNTHP